MSGLISKSELLEDLVSYRNIWCCAGGKDDVDNMIDIVQGKETVDAEPVRHGRWIHTTKEDSDWGETFYRYTCTACNWSMGDNPTGWGRFCPNCGAKMDGE